MTCDSLSGTQLPAVGIGGHTLRDSSLIMYKGKMRFESEVPGTFPGVVWEDSSKNEPLEKPAEGHSW